MSTESFPVCIPPAHIILLLLLPTPNPQPPTPNPNPHPQIEHQCFVLTTIFQAPRTLPHSSAQKCLKSARRSQLCGNPSHLFNGAR